MGVARQERECRRLATEHGLDVVEVYVDNDMSASSLKRPRPRYQEMLAAVAEGEVDAIIARHDDRLHRHPREMEDFIDLVEATKVEVLLIDGFRDFRTARGRSEARNEVNRGKYESERKGERLALMHEDIAAQGRWKGGPRPYGYSPAGDGRLEVVPAEAEVIRHAAAKVLAGETLYGICRDLNAADVPAAKGGGWRTPSLARILTAPMVAGRREFHGEDLGPATGWEPILDEVTWRRVRTALDYGKPKRPGRPPTYLLTGGLARCAQCGRPLHAQRTTKGARRYACTKSPDYPGACGRMTISADPFERLVTEMVFAAVDTPDLAAAGATHQEDAEADDAAEAVAEDEAKLAELADMWDAGDITRAEWMRLRSKVEARLDDARAKMARRSRSRATDAFAGKAGALATAWPGMTLDERRAVLTAVVDRVTVDAATRRGPVFDGDRVNVAWKA